MIIVGMVLLGCLFGWCFIGLIWPSIAGLMGLVLVNALSLKEAFAGGWRSTTLLLIYRQTRHILQNAEN